MVYAPVFEQLPGSAKEAIYRRMWQVLSGAERHSACEFADDAVRLVEQKNPTVRAESESQICA